MVNEHWNKSPDPISAVLSRLDRALPPWSFTKACLTFCFRPSANFFFRDNVLILVVYGNWKYKEYQKIEWTRGIFLILLIPIWAQGNCNPADFIFGLVRWIDEWMDGLMGSGAIYFGFYCQKKCIRKLSWVAKLT